MKEGSAVEELLREARDIRQRSRTSCVDLQNYLLYQAQALQSRSSTFLSCHMCTRPKPEASQQFVRAFKTMSRLEQAEFYLMNVRHVDKFIAAEASQRDQVQLRAVQNHSQPIVNIKFQIKDKTIYKKFTEVSASIITGSKTIKIDEAKQEIDLHNYILRKSRGKIQNCLVLQSVEPFTAAETIRLSFNSIDFQDSLNIIYKIWEESQYENIRKLMISDNRFPRRVEGHKPHMIKSSFEFPVQGDPITAKLSQKNEQPYSSSRLTERIREQEQQGPSNQPAHLSRIERKLLTEELIQSLNSFSNFTQKSFGSYVEKGGQRVRRVFDIVEEGTTIDRICLAIDEVRHMKKRKLVIKDLKHLNSIPSQRTNLYREIDLIEGTDYEFLYFRHLFTRSSVIYYIEKSIELEEFNKKPEDLIRGTIRHCIWRIRTLDHRIEVLVEADITYNRKINDPDKVTFSYIGQFSNYLKKQMQEEKEGKLIDSESIKTDEFENEYISQISNTEEEFFTVAGSLNSTSQAPRAQASGDDVDVTEINMKKTSSELLNQKLGQVTSRQTTESSRPIDHYLRCRYQMAPKPKDSPILMKEPSGHLLFGSEWVISSTGELVNVNKQKIKMQSSVLKLVLQRMGKNLMTGKSIINMSLPIQIFGTDSNLERIARGYIYAPIFLQRAASTDDPLERIKNIFCFGLGFSTSYIKMEKPFNPVLGQTYQGVIDGCPVYAEQISHHPPISSMLFIGRGYRVNGNFEAKVQLGLNSASGINEGFNFISIQKDGTVVKFNTPPGEIQGVIFGERRLTLVKKSYYIDQSNMIFCEIAWGKRKNSNRQQGQLNDFFSGKVVKLKAGTNIKQYKNIRPKDIQKEYGELHGRFTGQVFFQEDLLFDLNEDAPYLIEDYAPCLQSDSRFRRDIIERRKNNFELAQDAKEQIQQRQRKDRRLQKSHHNHS